MCCWPERRGCALYMCRIWQEITSNQQRPFTMWCLSITNQRRPRPGCKQLQACVMQFQVTVDEDSNLETIFCGKPTEAFSGWVYGVSDSATFHHPCGVGVRQKTVSVCDTGNAVLRMVTSARAMWKLLESLRTGVWSAEVCSSPTGWPFKNVYNIFFCSEAELS